MIIELSGTVKVDDGNLYTAKISMQQSDARVISYRNKNSSTCIMAKTVTVPDEEKSMSALSSKQQVIFVQRPPNSIVTLSDDSSSVNITESFGTTDQNVNSTSLSNSNVKIVFTQSLGLSMQSISNVKQLSSNKESVQVISKDFLSSIGSAQQTGALAEKEINLGIPTEMLVPSSQHLPISSQTVLLGGSPAKMVPLTKQKSTSFSTQVLQTVQKSPNKQVVYMLSPSKNAVIPMSVPRLPQKIAPADTAVNNSKIIIAHESTTSKAELFISKQSLVPNSPQKIMLKPVVFTTLKSSAPSTMPQSQFRLVAPSSSSQRSLITKQITPRVPTSASVLPLQLPTNRYSCVQLVSATNSQNLTVKQSAGAIRPTLTLLSNNQKVSVQLNSHSGPNQNLLIPASSVSKISPCQPASLTLEEIQRQTLLTGGNSISKYVVIPANSQYQVHQNGQVLCGSKQTTKVILPSGQVPTLLPATPLEASGTPSHCHSTVIPVSCTSSAGINFESEPSQSTVPSQRLNQQETNQHGEQAQEERPRRPCNCSKSQCLKLYCDCFANGEFCSTCNCTSCFNNLDHEEERQKAIKNCLERNPYAFHPKIGKYRDGIVQRCHTKGCNCKRSGCLKKYCECYEGKILCTHLCKCVGCKNIEDNFERKTLMQLADAAEVRVQQQAAAKTKISFQLENFPTRPANFTAEGHRLPCAFVTQEVVEATTQCLLAQGEDADRSEQAFLLVERSVLEEFGKCLRKIIECANKPTECERMTLISSEVTWMILVPG
ncbi:protein lin-54 homolog isoform X2 [Limulus polyphemus]|uniref:Protein lin-54 homolog isoform X2 n=1 Tax=Limulus polyphemus TaxID=6850 RepID=A0ABM1THS5_LIMPO|nr:protein lin-54 homolog isoform X2 [Limulus polyphemus]